MVKIIRRVRDIPEREGHKIVIHKCTGCNFFNDCDANIYKDNGWCYTYVDKNN